MTTLTKGQRKTFGPVCYTEHGRTYEITAKVRHDDQCNNGHNTFSITGNILEVMPNGRKVDHAGGCIHEDIAKHFPHLAPLIKWHLCSTDGPLHYVANAVYFAGDRDHWGLRKGEFRQHTSRGKIQNNGVEGVPGWVLKLPKDTPARCYAAKKPAPVVCEWVPEGITGEGKPRELDAARRAAIWPEATDEELTAPDLKEKLEARLPGLMAEFREAVESLGFTY